MSKGAAHDGVRPMRVPAGSAIRVTGDYWAAGTPYVVNGEQVKFAAPFDGSMIYYILAFTLPEDGWPAFDDVPSEL